MTYTDNLHLSLPEYADPMDVTPINANMQTLDAALTAEGEARAAAISNEASARAAGDTALRNAVASCYQPGNLPYVVGSYTGSGGKRTIELGFAPSFVLVNGTAQDSDDWARYTACAGCGLDDSPLRLTDSGFTVRSDTVPITNEYERPYLYIAFR